MAYISEKTIVTESPIKKEEQNGRENDKTGKILDTI